jgi:hypothetical protein
MNQTIRNFLHDSYEPSSDGRGQLIGTVRYRPRFGDQSLETILQEIEDHYEERISNMEDTIEELQEDIMELKEEVL